MRSGTEQDCVEVAVSEDLAQAVRGLQTKGRGMTTKPVTGIKITKDGKVKSAAYFRDASAAIRAKKSKRVRVVKGKAK